MTDAAVAAVPAVTNPFPGLRPFQEGEQHLFFGREAQVDTLVDRLGAARLLAVVGTSGSGKSSLVNCGLVPALHRGLLDQAQGGWRVATMRPGNRPLPALADALVRAGLVASVPGGAAPGRAGSPDSADDPGFTPAELVAATLRMSKRGLLDTYALARLTERPNLLLVVDQFEELFRYRGLDGSAGPAGASGLDAPAGQASADARAFVDLLLDAAAQQALPIWIVLTMRSDFLGDCAQFFGLPEAINRGQYLVPRLTRDERRAAIAGPVAVAGARIDPVLLTRLVNDVGDNPDQLSILQHALHRTWARWLADGGQGPLALVHYEAVGTMARALDAHAEEAYAALADARQRQVCEALFRALTDKGSDARGTRRPTRLDQLVSITRASADELRAVVEVFREPSRAFLMPPAGSAVRGDTPIDIAHESLMRVWQRLRAWVDQEAQSAQVYRRLAETAELHAAGQAGLLRPPDLPFATAWRAREQPTDAWAARLRPGFAEAMAFLQRSQDAFDAEQQLEAQARADALARQRRRRRGQLWGGGVLVLAGLVTAFVLLIGRARDAEQELQAKAADAALRDRLRKLEEATAAQAETEALVARRLQSERQYERNASAAQAVPAPSPVVQAKPAAAARPVPMPAPRPATPATAVQPAVPGEDMAASATPSTAAARPSPPAVATDRPLVYLQYVDAQQWAATQRLRTALGQSGYSAPKAEKVPAGPSATEVRYFRAADAAQATALAQRLQQAGWTQPRLRLIEGYAKAGQQPPLEVWLAADNPVQIRGLVDQLNADSADIRRAAGQWLQDRYTASPRAIVAVLATLQAGAVDRLSPSGRINALYFLTRTAPLAWDPEPVAQARETSTRLRARPDSGEQTRAELDRLDRLLAGLGTASPAPPR